MSVCSRKRISKPQLLSLSLSLFVFLVCVYLWSPTTTGTTTSDWKNNDYDGDDEQLAANQTTATTTSLTTAARRNTGKMVRMVKAGGCALAAAFHALPFILRSLCWLLDDGLTREIWKYLTAV